MLPSPFPSSFTPQSWQGLGCKVANVTPWHKKSWKQNPWRQRLVSLTSVPGKVTGQIIPVPHPAHAGQPRAQAQPAGPCEGQVLPDLPDLLWPMGIRAGLWTWLPALSKASATLSHITPLAKLPAQGWAVALVAGSVLLGRAREGWGMLLHPGGICHCAGASPG